MITAGLHPGVFSGRTIRKGARAFLFGSALLAGLWSAPSRALAQGGAEVGTTSFDAGRVFLLNLDYWRNDHQIDTARCDFVIRRRSPLLLSEIISTGTLLLHIQRPSFEEGQERSLVRYYIESRTRPTTSTIEPVVNHIWNDGRAITVYIPESQTAYVHQYAQDTRNLYNYILLGFMVNSSIESRFSVERPDPDRGRLILRPRYGGHEVDWVTLLQLDFNTETYYPTRVYYEEETSGRETEILIRDVQINDTFDNWEMKLSSTYPRDTTIIRR